MLTRAPMKGFGELEQLIGSAIFSRISSRISAASFVTGTLPVDGGYLACGLNQWLPLNSMSYVRSLVS